MKGFLTLCSAVLALLKVVCIPAEAQDAEMTDTLARAVISSSRPAIASTGLKRFDGGELLGGAAILGSPDVLKFLQNLPGVASGMELMSGLYVRGGDGSDNLFMLDGVPLFQVSHLAGIFSSFNTDVIESLDFYESGFPARYGGRLSSIVDIRTKNGSMEDFGGSVSVGLIDGRINLNGPIVRNKLSYDIAIRRSWLDALVAPVLAIENSGNKTKTNGGYALFDSNLNLTYTPGPRDILNLRFYMGSDNFNYSNTTEEKYYGKEIYYSESGTSLKMKWGNLAASAGWKHLISRHSRINTLLYFSRAFSNIRDWQKTDDFSNEILTSTGSAGNTAGNVTAAGFRSIFLHSASHHNLSAGIEYRSSWFNPSRSEERNVDDRLSSSVSSIEDYRSDEASVFVEDEMTYGPFSLTAGIRLDGYFSEGAAYFRPQPRISTSYNLSEGVIVKASYEAASQYDHLLSSIYLDLPTNLWMPSTDRIRPSDSHQVTAGTYVRLSRKLHLDVSGYYRSIENCLIYSGNGSLFPSIDRWEDEFVSGRGRSYGAEIELQYLSGKFRGSAFYTLSWSERKFDALLDSWFRDRFDNRHKLTLTGSWRINEHIDMNATWNFHSGNRVTVPEHTVSLPDGGSRFLFSEPYNAKLPDYHRLDISCNFRKRTKRGNERIWNISIYNAYCRMNPIMMRVTTNEELKPVATGYSFVPIIPSFSYTLKF